MKGFRGFFLSGSIGVGMASLVMLHSPIVPASLASAACLGARFAPQTVFPAGGVAEGIAVADFNEDGNLDLAVTNFTSGGGPNAVAILLGNGQGTFAAPSRFTVGRGATRIVASDFNADGRADVAVLNTNEGTISILLGDGHGGFGAQTAFPAGGTAAGLALGDFNGDGASDLVVANFLSDRITFLFGSGNGSFSEPASIPVVGEPLLVDVGDLNADGWLDVAVVNAADATVAILLGHGDGTFAAPTIVPLPDGAFGESLALADLDGDGVLDMAVLNSFDDTVVVFVGRGDASFGDAAAFPTGGVPIFLDVGDVNNDGRPDLVVGNADDASVSVLIGRGDGSFDPETRLRVGNEPIPVRLGDFNRDGGLDIAAGNLLDQTVSILLNECTGNRPPVASAGPDQVLECTEDGRAVARLDATGSLDPDSTPGTTDDIAGFEWSEQGRPFADEATASIALSLGTHAVAVSVTDAAGAVDSDTASISVRDTTPPRIRSIAANPAVLSPPDQRLVPVSIKVVAADTCDAAPTCRIDSVTSNLPSPSLGRGGRGAAAILSDRGPKTSPATLGVLLRADRTGAGSGRIYTIDVSCRDTAGQVARGRTTVSVASPHAQRF